MTFRMSTNRWWYEWAYFALLKNRKVPFCECYHQNHRNAWEWPKLIWPKTLNLLKSMGILAKLIVSQLFVWAVRARKRLTSFCKTRKVIIERASAFWSSALKRWRTKVIKTNWRLRARAFVELARGSCDIFLSSSSSPLFHLIGPRWIYCEVRRE